jgi:NAD(P)-dependent dehydrogenase (short-subunit alcohol dehydrogenase family)
MALPSHEYTENGFEKQIGVNHFGHFYLTSLLRPRLESQNVPSRIIVLSSRAHTRGEIDLNDLHFNKGRAYSGFSSYCQSKLANILFAKSLADQFTAAQKPIKVMSVHPGLLLLLIDIYI